MKLSRTRLLKIAAIIFSAFGVCSAARYFISTSPGIADLELDFTSAYPFLAGDGVTPLSGITLTPGVVQVVPEMETWAMMIAELGFIGWKLRRRQQRSS
ncbi:MAG: hypothetical protein OEZ43_20035 [Gammaproteobacteria bacterium]|nr:hypothetical protein [Gammaproteobacteria bacterium]